MAQDEPQGLTPEQIKEIGEALADHIMTGEPHGLALSDEQVRTILLKAMEVLDERQGSS